MKTKLFSLLIFVIFLGCDKDKNTEPSFQDNTFIAQRANETWKGTTEIGLTANDTLIFLAVGDGLDNGVMVAKIKFDGIGPYTLNHREGIYYNTLGGDVLISQYAIEDGSNGLFSITTYDQESRFIEGRFEIPLRATKLNNPEIKDSLLIISDGLFKGFIRKDILE
ncbi:hypothetical protein [Maribacter sp. IgM3_T14_3]|uniref:hypothetical protein n=1 Tax=Maribacter sp. IgM3_T14_3 TaxID=3415140 RepID=UPI003C6EBCC7